MMIKVVVSVSFWGADYILTIYIGLALSPQTVSSKKPMTTICLFRLSGQFHKQTLINQQHGQNFQTDIEGAPNKIEPDSMYVYTAKLRLKLRAFVSLNFFSGSIYQPT